MKTLRFILGILVCSVFAISCQNEMLEDSASISHAGITKAMESRSASTSSLPFFKGADLSYINELEDVGVSYYDADGDSVEPYTVVHDYGANMIRLRLSQNRHSLYENIVKNLNL